MLKENNLEMLLFRSRYLKQKNYWTRKLSGQMETTDILTASKKYRGDTFEIGDNSASVNRGHDEIPFDDELSRRILNMCKHSELSLYIFLLSALKALIHRYTNHKDIIVFSPIHGGKADEETINSLVLICQHVDGTRTFKELVLSLRKSVLEAYENQDYPYEKLEKFLFPSTSPSHISCWLENFHRKADIEKIKTRLSFCFSTRGEKIQGCVLYDPNFYRQSEIHGLANHFLLLLNRVGENIDTLISNIIFVTEEEKNLLLKEFNNNKVDFYRNKTLPRWIEEQVEKAADAVAIVCNHHQITYIELNQRANRIANLLRIYNLQQDRTVGILFHRSIPMVESILAAWKAGGAYIPLDTDDPVQRLQGILADSAAAVLLGQSQWVTPQLEKTYEGSILRLDPQQKEVHRDKENRGNLNLNTAPGSLAYVIYTSGSTGKPKGAMVEHIGMMNHIHAKIANLQITAKSIVAQNASHTFDISVWQFFAALTTGGKTIVYPNRLVYEPDRFISRVVEDQVTILEVVPSYQAVMLEFLDANFRHFDSLEYLLVTGETIKPALVNQWFDKYPAVKMVNAYGPTEASDDITHYIMDKAPDMERVPIGKPVRNLNIYILDEYMNLCPLGIVGEICVSGIGVGRGYLNNPELTFERFLFVSYKSNKSYMAYIPKKIYLTGDLGRWLPDGVIEFFGRKDYQVKIRGVRIELGEIENHLSAYPGIKEVVVIIKTVGRGDGSDQPAASYLCAYLVPAPGKQPDILAIKEYLAKHLPDYMIPDNFVELEHIPLTANGKIDRKVLSRLDDRIPMKKDHVAPRDKVENQLVQVWADVLGIESSLIGIDTSFFELGGNSLRATVLISKLNRVFNVMIPLAELFQTPTVRHLAQYIGGLKENRFASIGVVEEKEYFRLSSAQKRLYVLQQMDQEGIGYNIPHAYELEGELDKNRLGNTFRGLIQRHESLRTSFDIVNGEPIQKIHHKAEFEVEYYDISKIEAEVKVKAYEGTGGLAPLSLEPVTRNPQPATALISSFIRPFDLSNSPLLRVGLIRLHTPPFGHPSQEGNVEDKHILIVDMHHIITDGISISLFIRESMALYAGEELPPLKFQYKDYAQWQNSEPQKKAIKEQEEFWLRQFADEVPVLDMPYDYLRPAIQSFAGAVLSFEVSADLTRSINRMALDTGATLYMVLLAIYNILLSKISGQENIVVGTPIAARRHADLQRIIGMFVNTLAMRNYPGGDKKFIDFLRKLQQRTLEAFENQEYQFEDLVGEIFVNRDTSRNPIFDTMFVLQNMEAQANEIPRVDIYQLTIRPYEIETRVSICDLLLSGFELEGKLHCAFVYCTKLFKKNTIERFVIYFKQILSAVLENRNQKISQIEIITAEEKRQILYNFNDTAAAYDGEKTLHQLFEEQVERTPDNTALTGSKLQNTNYKQNGVMHLSYRKLNEKSHQLAVLLIEKGVKPDTIVGIMLERSLEMVTGILGILKAGGAYLPIDPDYTGERINYMLADSGAKILLSADHHPDLPSSPLPSFSHLHLPPAPATCLAYIIYTSGSTGKPKGVLVEHRSVVNILTALQTLYPLKRFDTYLLKTSYLFDVSVTELFGWFREGGRLALLEKDDEKDPAKIIDIIEREGITHINFVPSMFGIFVDQLYINTGNVKKLSNLKYIFLAGEALLPGLVEKFSQLNTPIPLKNIYGPTEGTIYSSLYSLSIWGGGIVPIGTPMSNIKLYIMDVNNRFQPKGVPGELYISGDGLARGYLNRPGLTADRFDHDFWDYQDEEKKDTIKKYNKKLLRGGPDASRGGFLEKSPVKHLARRRQKIYKTGDLARWLVDGNIEFLGRMDYQIKIRGFRIEPGEIENCLLAHDNIKEAVVLVKNDETGDKYLCAYIVSDREQLVSELRGFLLRYLPDYMVPSYFMRVEKIPLTPGGKIDRKALPEPGIEINTLYIGPGNRIERKLQWIWSDLLSLEKEKISIDVNFFALGGHSLKATVMIARIHKYLNVKITLADIFRSPTIRDLSSTIKESVKEAYISIELVEKKEYYDLSSAQKRLYVLQRMELNSTPYNIPLTLILEGKLDKNRLEGTFRELIERHESLRTSFLMINGEPIQRIHEKVEFNIEYYDISKVEDEEKEQTTDDRRQTTGGRRQKTEGKSATHLSSEIIRPFDLAHSPLLRVGLISLHTPPIGNPSQEQTVEDKHILVIDMHHIVTDGVSMDLFVRESMALYSGEKLPPLRLRYRDYSEWQNSDRQKKAIKEQKEYWLRQFADEAPVLDLPYDYPRPAVQSFAGAVLSFEVSADLTRSINRMALDTGATLYMVLLAIYNILLSKISGQEDIVVGTPIAARRHADLQRIIGMFVNTLAPRNYPNREKTAREFLEKVKESTLQAFENQEYQFEDLVEQVSVNRDTSRNPLFDTMFALQNMEAQSSEIPLPDIPQLRIRPYETENRTAQFDLNLTCFETREKLLCSLEYCTKLFKKETIKRFVIYFQQILSAFLKDSNQKISQIEIITAEEKRQILYEFNDTAAAYDGEKTLHRLFTEQVERTPDNIAVVGPLQMKYKTHRAYMTYMTYSELNKKSNQLAYYLIEKGVRTDTIVGIMVERSLEMITGIFGILKAGGAYMPIDPDYPQDRIDFMLKDSTAKILLTGQEIAGLYSPQTLYLSEGHHPVFPPSQLHNFPASLPSSLAYVIYTSGSTGYPKGVLLQHRPVVNRLNWMQKAYPIDASDTLLQKTTYTFDVSVWEIFWWSMKGAKLRLVEPKGEKDPAIIIDNIETAKITVIHFVPSMLSVFLDYLKESREVNRLNSLKYVIASGEALTSLHVNRFYQVLGSGDSNPPKLSNLYGPTEAAVDVSSFDCPGDFSPAVIPIGKPIDNIRLYILDKYLYLQPVGIPGELCIAGHGLARGYLNRPGLTAEKFDHDLWDVQDYRDGYHRPYRSYKSYIYRSGDLARWHTDGNIEFLGRIDHQVKIRGLRIELGEIETQLLTYEGIKETVVVAKTGKNGDKILCAYFVSHIDITAEALRGFLSGRLPEYMVPQYFIPVERIPLTLNGKVDRKQLPAPGFMPGHNYIAPRGELEKELVDIWSGLLNLEKEKISTNANFFQLGGHSLRAITMSTKIHKQLDVRVPLTKIFQSPTIQALARYIENAEIEEFKPLHPVEKKEYYLLSSAQKRLYIIQQMELNSIVYNMPMIFPLEMEIIGVEINKEKLEHTIRRLIHRHESIRTYFHVVGTQMVQGIQPAHEVDFAIENYYIKDTDAAGESLPAIVKNILKKFIRPFDLTHAPLVRTGLFITREQRYILLVDMHHIISDLVSHDILIRDFTSLAAGRELPRLRLQYKDYAQWQNSVETKKSLNRQEEYWINEYKGEIPLLRFPVDYERTGNLHFQGDSVGFTIDRTLSSKIKVQARELNVTVMIYLFSLYDILIARYSGQEELVVGTVAAGRQHADLQNIIGFFVNMLPIKTRPHLDKTFSQYLAEVKEKAVNAYENQGYPFEELVSKLDIPREPGRHPLVDVVFAFQNQPGSPESPRRNNPEVQDFNFFNSARFDLMLHTVEEPDAIQMVLQYPSDLFKRSTIEEFTNFYLEILLQTVENPDIKLKEIKMNLQLMASSPGILQDSKDDWEL